MSDHLESTPGLDAADQDFLGRVALVNPFLDNRVNGPSSGEADVPAVHGPAFERLTSLAREAHSARRGIGVVLWGEAGVGKSHTLARLGRWASEQAYFVYLHNLQADPSNLARTFLHLVVSSLSLGRRDRLASTPLYQLARAGVQEAIGAHTGFHSWDVLLRAYHGWVDGLVPTGVPGSTGIDRAPFDVLFTLFRSATRAAQGKEDGSTAALALRWLSGQALDPAEARQVGLPPARHRDELVALEDAQQIKQVLVALSILAGASGKPFILALDQADNLEAEQFAALSRFLEALIDSAPNLLVVVAGIQASLIGWREQKVVQSSAWDRLAQFEVRLSRLSADEARAVVRQRLESFRQQHTDSDLVAKGTATDELFPLGADWAKQNLAGRADLRPRGVINSAREGWRQEQDRLRHLGAANWLAGWGVAHAQPSAEAPPDATLAEMDIAELAGEGFDVLVPSEVHSADFEIVPSPFPEVPASDEVEVAEVEPSATLPSDEDIFGFEPTPAEGSSSRSAKSGTLDDIFLGDEAAAVTGSEEWDEKAAIDHLVGERIEEHVAMRERERGGLPPNAEQMAGLICHLLQGCRDAGLYGVTEAQRIPAPRKGVQLTYHFELTQKVDDNRPEVRTGVAVVTQPNALTVTSFLRRLREDDRPLDRVVLVTEERYGLPLGPQGWGYIEALRQEGPERFREVELTFSEHATLDALQAVIGAARSGDLEVCAPGGPPQVLSQEDVVKSHHRQDRYRRHRLLRELLVGTSEAADLGEIEVLSS